MAFARQCTKDISGDSNKQILDKYGASFSFGGSGGEAIIHGRLCLSSESNICRIECDAIDMKDFDNSISLHVLSLIL